MPPFATDMYSLSEDKEHVVESKNIYFSILMKKWKAIIDDFRSRLEK